MRYSSQERLEIIRQGNIRFRWLMDHAHGEPEVFVTTAFELSKYCASTWAKGDVSEIGRAHV